MNEAIVIEYVDLCTRLAALDAETEEQLYTRLDQLWYAEMTDADRTEAEKRLTALDSKDRAWHDARRTEDPL